MCVGVVAIGWQSYLSYLNQRVVDEEGAGVKLLPSTTDGVEMPACVQSASSNAQA